MVDVLMLAIITAFFALAWALVKGCEKIIGPDVEAARAEADAATKTEPSEQAAA